jgi:inner membrane protease subunit 2
MASRVTPLISQIWHSTPRRTVTYVVSTTAALAFIQGTLVDLHSVNGPSMSPTLSPGVHETGQKDYIITLKRNTRGKPTNPDHEALIGEWTRPARSTLRRGDLVTFWKPHNPDMLGVKRVVGLEGDTIVRNVKRVGKQDKEGGRESEKMGMGVPPVVIKVPPGHVWVEGDNWRHTVDSNDYGAVGLPM